MIKFSGFPSLWLTIADLEYYYPSVTPRIRSLFRYKNKNGLNAIIKHDCVRKGSNQWGKRILVNRTKFEDWYFEKTGNYIRKKESLVGNEKDLKNRITEKDSLIRWIYYVRSY